MIATKTTIQCQQCAGKVSVVPGREYMQCDYCQSLVFDSNNPLIVDRIVSMGERLQQADCPVCKTGLTTGQIEKCPVLYCDGCFGLLIRNEHFGSIVRERRARRSGHESQACQPLNSDEYNRRICCPNCTNQMEVHPYYGPGNIVIDSCSGCQYIWLDHGELRTVERAEGGKEPELLPIHVDENGELTIIPPPQTASPRGIHNSEDCAISKLADFIFGF
jgi:Zn-finger nucleic acid-binding protein